MRYRCIASDSLLWLLKKLHLDLQWPLHRALPLFTRNAADILKFSHKGKIELGMDGDLLILKAETLGRYVFMAVLL